MTETRPLVSRHAGVQVQLPAWNDVRRMLRSLPTLERYKTDGAGTTVRLTTHWDFTLVAVAAEAFAGGVVGFLAAGLWPGEHRSERPLLAYVAVPHRGTALITGRGLLPDPDGTDFRLPVYRCRLEVVGLA